jgi:putative spermidine/putrescine transport system ATP-binding protein
MPNPGQFVQMRSVNKSYDGRTLVVSDLDLDVSEGEFLTLLGPSGSGKTTCLMMLAGFETANSGDIVVAGSRINNLPAHKRGIGMVFQSYALFPHMTVAENVGFPLKQRRIERTEIQRRVKQALEMVELGTLGARYPSQLSGGQQQRVALARAMVFEPRLILMDEPLGALDRRLREHMQLEIKALHRRIQTTIIYVTHDQTEALTMSDRVAVFNKGKIEQIDRPEAVYERPATEFVANFIGENNTLRGTVEELREATAMIRLDEGALVAAVVVGSLSVGDPVSVAVRPERLLLAEHTGAYGKIEASLESPVYNGDHVMVPLRLRDGSALRAKLPISSIQDRQLLNAATLNLGWEGVNARAYRRA